MLRTDTHQFWSSDNSLPESRVSLNIEVTNSAYSIKGPLPKNEMSVSYADAASTKVPLKAEESVSEQTHSPSSPTNSTTTTTSEADNALKEEQKPVEKPSKTLAPAPVPAKSVWGSTPSQSVTPLVDEHKFPSPGLIPQATSNASKNNVKFGKSNKWIPITAKVVFSSPRNTASSSSNNSSQKAKRKSKTPRKKSTSSNSNGEALGKKDDHQNGQKLETDSDATASDAPTETDAHSLGQDQQPHSSAASGEAKQRQNLNTNYSQQKNYKKYPNGAYGARAPGAQQQQQMPMHRHQGNGYYQPMVGQQFNGNGKQFRTIPGPYGRNGSNGNLAMGGFIPNNGVRQIPGSMPFIPHHPQPMMSGMPFNPSMPIQIPPPLSPKQNPQQALTRQIDYYFSLDNLLRDLFLRKNMGTEGWVDLDLILNFKRVEIIINGLRNSIEETDEKAKEDQLDKAIVNAVHQCENLEIGYLNGKEDYNVSATEMQLRVKYNFEQWLLPDNL